MSLIASCKEQRAVYVFWAKGLKPTEIITEMLLVYGQKCLTQSYTVVATSFLEVVEVNEKRPGQQIVAANNDIAKKFDVSFSPSRVYLKYCSIQLFICN